jgi:hypothetical protein
LRQIILLAGTKNAQLSTAQDKLIHLGQTIGQFYCELVGGDENDSELKRVRQIQSTLKELIDTDLDDKRCDIIKLF